MLKKLIAMVIILVFFTVSVLIVESNPGIQQSKIINDEFMLNFLGLFLGVSVAIVTFLFSSVDKIRESIIKAGFDGAAKKQTETTINNLIEELKQDSMAIFVFLVLFFGTILLKDIDVPYLKIAIWDKSSILSSIKLTLVFLTLFSIYDIISSTFLLMKVSHKLDITDD